MSIEFPLPDNLPIPKDDGLCKHLEGTSVPSVALSSTDRELVDLSSLSGWIIVYCYPLSGRPGCALPEDWDQIPGARGCTPQSCAFRDEFSRIASMGVRLYGLSSQSNEYQSELVQCLHLPFPILSDDKLELATALKLPTFEIGNQTLIKRLTLVISDGRIEKVFYPIFPPDKNPMDVIRWLECVGVD